MVNQNEFKLINWVDLKTHFWEAESLCKLILQKFPSSKEPGLTTGTLNITFLPRESCVWPWTFTTIYSEYYYKTLSKYSLPLYTYSLRFGSAFIIVVEELLGPTCVIKTNYLSLSFSNSFLKNSLASSSTSFSD